MKNFLPQSLELIFIIIGTAISYLSTQYADKIINTKYEVIFKAYFVVIMAVGIYTVWISIARWILK